jgi:putative tricarboxylic transport membrane protein
MMKAATKEWLCIAGMLGVNAFFFFQLPDKSEQGSNLFPGLMMFLMLGLTLIKAVAELRFPKSDSGEKQEPFPLVRVLVVIVAAILYIAVIETLGFYFSSFLFFFLTTVAVQTTPRTPRALAVRMGIAFGFVFFLYALFSLLLQVQIPKGIVI